MIVPVLGLFAIFWVGGQSAVAASAPSVVSFKFDRPTPGVGVPHYSFEVHADGTAIYRAEVAMPKSAETQPVEKQLMLLPATVRSAWEAVRQMRESRAPCASVLKNIADTGSKTVAYRDAAGEGSCTYNYSENKGVMQLTDLFQRMELTLESGRALEFKHRFDRLGLDAEMIALTANVETGRAAGLETIAPALRSIAGDTELIERVRLQAAKLLERVH